MTETHKLHPKARWAILSQHILFTLAIGIGGALLYALLGAFHLPTKVFSIYRIIYIIALILCLLDMLGSTLIGYRQYRYALTSDFIYIRSGYFDISEEYLPLERLQKIELSAGPILRCLGLTKIELYSAGGRLEIDYLENHEAHRISEELSKEVNLLVQNEEESHG